MAAYAFYAQKYDKVFFEGTKINGIDVGDKGVEYIAEILKEDVRKYDLTVTFRDGTTEILDFDELSLKYDPSEDIQKILDSQNIYEWYRLYRDKTGKFPGSYTVATDYSYDEKAIKEMVEGLPEMHDENAPKDAYIRLNETYFEIVPEEEGNRINTEVVEDRIYKAVVDKEESLNITDIEDSYVEPQIRSDDPGLKEETARLNKICTAVVTYDLGEDKKKATDNSLILPCFIQDKDGNYKIDEAKLKENCRKFISDMAEEDDYTSDTINWHSTHKGDYTMYCSTYGHVINVDAETENLAADLSSGNVTERQPEYSLNSKAPSAPSTYVEVDIDRQHVWFYKNGSLMMDTDCVTGTASDPQRRTSKGFFSVFFMQRERDLKGRPDETGAPSYISHVKYWMAFNGGEGLHDASWRSSFGGSIYKESGSHGCVNLPEWFAAKLYEQCYVGMPVMVV